MLIWDLKFEVDEITQGLKIRGPNCTHLGLNLW